MTWRPITKAEWRSSHADPEAVLVPVDNAIPGGDPFMLVTTGRDLTKALNHLAPIVGDAKLDAPEHHVWFRCLGEAGNAVRLYVHKGRCGMSVVLNGAAVFSVSGYHDAFSIPFWRIRQLADAAKHERVAIIEHRGIVTVYTGH